MSKQKHKGKKSKKVRQNKESKSLLYILLGAILISTFIVYLPALNNEFTNWDDPTYVTENKLIRSTSLDAVKEMFSTSNPVSLNYHPLTIYSLALNYSFSELEPYSYFLVNIIIHLLNTLILFFFIRKLSNGNIWIAAATSAWFAVHPMHVESVAWISERKDVLYTFFFLASIYVYLSYLNKQQKKLLIYSIVLFIASCLSKAMAVSLVPVLFLIDFLKERKFNKELMLEKVPYVIIALLVGYNAVVTQSQEAINEFSTFTIAQRFMFASYGFMTYVGKLFVPYYLSAFYPYPNVNDLGNIPVIFYWAPVISLAIVVLPGLLIWKRSPNFLKTYIFGMGLFIATIVLVLQFISVGSAIMAERYSYIPYIGIFFFVSTFAYKRLKNEKIFIALFIVSSLAFAYVARERVHVWSNNETLWTDVIEKYPMRVEVAYKNRGNYFAQNNRLEEAYQDHVTLIEGMKSNDVGAIVNFANICGLRKEYERSMNAYNKALELKKENNADIYLNRAITFSMMQQYEKALADFAIAEQGLKGNDDKLLQNRAFVYLQIKDHDKAIRDYTELMKRFSKVRDYPFNRGLAHFNKGMLNEAIQDFGLSVQLDPNYKEAYFNLSVAYSQLNNKPKAMEFAKKAQSLGYPVNEAYLSKLR